MARLQDFPSVTPTSSDKILIVQSQGQGLAPHTIKLDSANPTGTGALSLNRKANTTVGTYSAAIGQECEASGNNCSFAEGYKTKASGLYGSHAEGQNTTASGQASHAEGRDNVASNSYAHAEGYSTTASGFYSHSEGKNTIANHKSQHVFGEFNVADASTAAATARGNYVEIVGKGADDANRSNARTLDWSGNEVLAGGLKVNGNQDVATKDSNTTTPYTIRKAGDIVCVRLSATSATFDTDGKTLTVSVPSGFRPYTDAQFYTKIYNGSAYVDCHVIFKSGGTVEISSLSNAAITGANITFLQQTFFTYIST